MEGCPALVYILHKPFSESSLWILSLFPLQDQPQTGSQQRMHLSISHMDLGQTSRALNLRVGLLLSVYRLAVACLTSNHLHLAPATVLRWLSLKPAAWPSELG